MSYVSNGRISLFKTNQKYKTRYVHLKTDNSKNVSYFTTFRGQEQNLLRIVFQFRHFSYFENLRGIYFNAAATFLTRIYIWQKYVEL